MHKISAICLARLTAFLLQWLVTEHPNSIVIEAILAAPSFVFLHGCSLFLAATDIFSQFPLDDFDSSIQFGLQYLVSTFLFNVLLHGLWHNVESFLHYILPRMLDEMISLSARGRWYGLVKIQDRVWTTNAALMLSFALLALVSSKLRHVEN